MKTASEVLSFWCFMAGFFLLLACSSAPMENEEEKPDLIGVISLDGPLWTDVDSDLRENYSTEHREHRQTGDDDRPVFRKYCTRSLAI